MHLLTLPPDGAFIFDKDGTLLDTETLWYETYERLLVLYGRAHDLITHQRMMGASPLACIELLAERHPNLPKDSSHLLDARESLFRDVRRERGIIPLPGVVAFLDACAERSIPLAIATSASRATTEEELRVLGWEKRFAAIVTADDVTRHKPAPDIYLEAARRLEVVPASCLAFEDGLRGLESAVTAGMSTVFLGDPRFGIEAPSTATYAANSFLDLHLH